MYDDFATDQVINTLQLMIKSDFEDVEKAYKEVFDTKKKWASNVVQHLCPKNCNILSSLLESSVLYDEWGNVYSNNINEYDDYKQLLYDILLLPIIVNKDELFEMYQYTQVS